MKPWLILGAAIAGLVAWKKSKATELVRQDPATGEVVPAAVPSAGPQVGLPPLTSTSPGQPTGSGPVVAAPAPASPSAPTPALPTGTPAVPDEILAGMTAALATNSANIIRAEAARLRGIGYIAQADQLDFVARQIEAVQMAAEAARQPPPPIAEPAVVPASAPRPAPPVVVMPPPQVPQVAAVDPLRERVAILVSHLRTHPKGSEDKALIGSYQANEPSYSGNIDGKYGPKTALAVASHGVVPPTPYYWAGPTAAMVGRQKAEYRQALEQKSFEDPIRAEEWKQAARAVK